MKEKPVTTGLHIGEKLKALRTGRGKTVEELARDAGMDPVVVSQIEKGVTTPPVGTLMRAVSPIPAALPSATTPAAASSSPNNQCATWP